MKIEGMGVKVNGPTWQVLSNLMACNIGNHKEEIEIILKAYVDILGEALIYVKAYPLPYYLATNNCD